MASLLRKSLTSKTKTSLKVSPALIKKMELFSSSYHSIQSKYSKKNISWTLAYTDNTSLDSFLLEQISNLLVSDQDATILSRMVDLLDEKGLFSNWSIVRENILKEFNISRRKAYELLSTFQELEPEGVGATSVKNFLEIQIKKHELDDILFKEKTLRILSFESELLAHDIKTISTKTGLSIEDISLSLLFIKNNLVYTLPRQQFNNKTQPISPSAKVTITQNKFEIEMLEDFSYVEDPGLFTILQERSENLKNILTIFFQKQRPALFQQSGLLKPLTQKSIAELTGMNPSTISRLVNSKYLFLNNKLFLFKSLFQRKVNNSNYSALFIKNFIKTNKDKTDKLIANELYTFGISVSRRTVNYYRHKLF